MADRLTQLQDCYDQLATQFYASIRYISLHHNASPFTPPRLPTSSQPNSQQNEAEAVADSTIVNHQIPPTTQPSQSQDQTQTQSTQAPSSSDPQQPSQPPQQQSDPASSITSALPPEQRPDTPTTFAAAQRELAHDLILKTKQIEYITSILPGVENSKERQEERIRELDGELREVLREREEVEGERERCLRRVEGVIGGLRR
ncbi:RNA polymerase II mediator complex subunit [Lecanora helva]